MIIHSYRERESATNMIELFTMHKNVGQLAFAIGNEMLSTLKLNKQQQQMMNNTTNNDQLNHTNTSSLYQQQNETDMAVKQMLNALKQKGYNGDQIEAMINEKLHYLRSKCNNWSINSSNNEIVTNSTIHHRNQTKQSSSMMIDCVRTYEKFFYNLDMELLPVYHHQQQSQSQQQNQSWLWERYSKLAMTDFSLRNMPYTLFIRGVIQRYTALGFGTILLATADFNNQKSIMKTFNISDYFHYYYSSRQQIESSFVWNQKFYQKYLEFEQSEYQTEMLVNHFNRWLMDIQQQYSQMSQLMIRLFTQETLNRMHSYLKKKNAESIERLMFVNGNRTKFITDQDANNQISIHVDSDFIESFGLQRIQHLINMAPQQPQQQQKSSTIDDVNNVMNEQYEQLTKDQVRFLIRVQDFLNISMYSHLVQTMINEQTNFIYHSIVVTILLKKNHCHHTSTLANVIFPCSNSNNAFLISSSTKRTIAGAVINRYCATPISSSSSSNNHQNQSINHNTNNNNQTKTSLSTYKFDNTRNNHGSGKNAINNGDTVAPIGPSLSSSSTTSTNSNHQIDCSIKHEKLSSIAEKNSECPKQKNNGIDDDDDNGNGNLAENNGCNDNNNK
ncbi:hypothetical protein HUG17_0563 [Dermatophagoides farinae]|uniref:Uncharacterized protein n=1 Tax=Dermatophagoides farinae TaxID=6954 RepID=A0A9D4SL22_DERFA|nr:hypothetical protein HUG17_0563 [Dermatophagoides farinae]